MRKLTQEFRCVRRQSYAKLRKLWRGALNRRGGAFAIADMHEADVAPYSHVVTEAPVMFRFKNPGRSFRLAVMLLSGSALAGVPLASAFADSTWLGATSADWFTAGNWAPAAVPTSADNVLIDLNATAPFVTGAAASANLLTIGQSNTAQLTVDTGGALSVNRIEIGQNTGSSGTLTVQAGAPLTDTGSLAIGDLGDGAMSVLGGATVTSGITSLGFSSGSTGSLLIDGTGSHMTVDLFTVGENGVGTMTISNGGLLTGQNDAAIGFFGDPANPAVSTATVTDSGSEWDLGMHTLTIGVSSHSSGSLMVSNNASLNVGRLEIAQDTQSAGSLTVESGATLINAGSLAIGDHGVGTMNVESGATVTSGITSLGFSPGSSGTLLVDGMNSHMTVDLFTVGENGVGNLTVSNGGLLTGQNDAAVGYFGDPANPAVSTATVRDSGSEWDLGAHALTVGVSSHSSGALTVSNGATVVAGMVEIARDSQSAGTVTVDGAGSGLGSTGNLVIADGGVGVLNVTNGGVANSLDISLGVQTGSSGTVNMSDTNSGFGASGTLHIGVAGNGAVNVDADSTLGASDVTLGEAASSTGTLLFSNGGGGTVTGTVSVGVNGTGSVTVAPTGGTFNANIVDLGVNAGSHGTVTISNNGGLGSSSTIANLIVGDAGTGTLAIGSAGFVLAQQSAVVGAQSGSSGTVTADGYLATLTTHVNAGLIVGRDSGATGTVTFSNSGTGALLKTELGVSSGATGTITVTDAGSEYQSFDDLYIGEGGTGTVNVKNGGLFRATALTIIGDNPGATGTLNIDGVGSIFTADDVMLVGGDAVNAAGGNGTVRVTNGGTLAGSGIFLGVLPSATATMLVDGAGSTVSATQVTVGYGATGNATVQNGGAITANILDIGGIPNSTGALIVDGAGSSASAAVLGAIGDFGNGTLLVRNGGAYSAGHVYIGYENAGGFTGVGTATVDGVGSTFTAQAVDVGLAGRGALIVANGGAATVTGALTVATQAGSSGEIDFGAAPGSAAVAPGSLVTSSITFGDGTGYLNFNHNSAGLTFSTPIIGAGTLNQLAGATFLPGDESTFTGQTNITGGALHVNGSLRNSAVAVSGGGTLNGNGTVGSVSAANGGIVAPGNSIGILTVNGNYNAASGSIYQAQVDSASHSDLLVVNGTATLANGAILNVSKIDAGAYVGGTQYTLLTAAGGINGTYTVTGDVMQSAFTSQTLSYDAHDVYLNVSKTATFASAGSTPNQIAVGGGADSLPTASPLYGTLIALPTFAVAQRAFDQLSGEIHASARTALIEDSRFVREAVLDRLQSPNTGHPVVWGQGFGDWGTNDGNGNAAATNRSTKGFIGGVDVPFDKAWRVGFLGGFSDTDLNVQARSSVGRSNNYHLGLYGGTEAGPVAVRLGAAYTWNDLQTARAAAFSGFSDQLTARYNGGTTQAFGEVGYKVAVDAVSLEPFANLAYVNLNMGAFKEAGGAAALSASSQASDTSFTTLGLHASQQLDLGTTAVITAKASLGWRHAFGALASVTNNVFTGTSSFGVGGVPVATDAAAIDAGLGAAVSDHLTLGLAYTGQVGTSAHDNGVKANLGWKF